MTSHLLEGGLISELSCRGSEGKLEEGRKGKWTEGGWRKEEGKDAGREDIPYYIAKFS